MRLGLCITLLLALPALAGCGGEAGTTTASSGSAQTTTATSSGHGPVARPSPERARAWRAAGRSACEGMGPREAALHFRAAAKRAGAHLRFVALVTQPTAAVEQSPAYPRLVAAFYATTRPEPQRALAAAGCAEELAARD